MRWHRHHWEIVGADTGKETRYFDGFTAAEDADTTEVLQRCGHCGSVRTSKLPGSWTLAQLRGEAQ